MKVTWEVTMTLNVHSKDADQKHPCIANEISVIAMQSKWNKKLQEK